MQLSAPGAAFWSEHESAVVSIHQPASGGAEWEAYVAGLQQCYGAFGAGHIVEREGLESQDCRLFFLVSDREGRLLGGIRAVGPVEDRSAIDAIPAVHELDGSPSSELIRSALADATVGGLIEVKGAWSGPGISGLGDLFARLFWHSGWWLGAGHAVVTSGVDQSIAKWQAFGGRPIPGVEPAPDFPVPGHHTVPLLLSFDRSTELPEPVQDQLAIERAYLHPARSRARGLPAAGHEITFGRTERARLEDAGVAAVSHVADLQQEAERCRSSDLGDNETHDLSPWVHFPWRREAIQILGPRRFHLLRTDRNRHKLTADELRLLRRKKVGVIGLSVGNSIAYTLAQEGLCGELRLADFDHLELTNLNRLAGSLTELGLAKTTIAARRIAELDPYLDVQLHPEGVTADNLGGFLDGLDLVIEECDSLDVKVMVRQAAAERGIPVVMETNDRGLLDIERFDLEPGRRPFHGVIGDVDVAAMAGLSTDDKVPYLIAILDAEGISTSMAASLVEIDETISSWPQLASDVALGAALAVTAARDILLGRAEQSGRLRVDLSNLASGAEEPRLPDRPPPPPVLVRRNPLPTDFRRAMLAAATLAPSGGNIQPWRFDLGDRHFSATAVPPGVGMDIGDRGTAVACGAALFNALCVAAAHGRLGHLGDDPLTAVSFEIDLDDPDRVGTLTLGDRADEELAALAKLIPARTTNRRLDPAAAPLDQAAVAALDEAARAAGGRTHFVANTALGPLTDIWAQSDRLRFLTERLHRELFDEIRRPGIEPLDVGLDERTLELSPGDLAKQSILRRPDVMARLSQWDGGRRLGEDTTNRLTQSAGLLVVSANGTTRADYARGGMALQRLWLEATRRKIGLQPISPIFGYAHEAEELIDLVGPERGQALVDMRESAFSAIGIQPGHAFVLALRAHLGPPPTAISARATDAAIDAGVGADVVEPAPAGESNR